MTYIWDQEADVVVLGYGGAGAVVAISAHDAGAKVIVVEKDEGGGNTRLATLTFLCPVAGAAAIEHIRALSFDTVEDEAIERYVEWTSTNVDFIGELGGEVQLCPPGATFPVLPGAEAMIRYRVKGKDGEFGGTSLWNLLSKNVEKRDIQIMRHTIARKLLREGDEIVGVEADNSEKHLRLSARRAVVLATGGFEFNENMKRDYLAGYPIHAIGHSGNRGDGIKMAQEVGADLWHMKAMAAPLGYKFPEHEAAFIMEMPAYGIKNPLYGFVIVDQQGQRFCDESALEKYSMWMEVMRFDTERLKYSRIPSYVIFDERTRLQGPITRLGHGANRGYTWSADNSAEIERGWIAYGDNPRELAAKLRIAPVERLEAGIEAYRTQCKEGKDDGFGRPKKTLQGLSGRLYAVPIWPCLLNTQGGPRRNARSQILDSQGTPIKRLYGAGELGSIWGFLYQSGGNLGECLGLGRMVGRLAAAEIPL